ncbi:1,3-beta-glucanosyltransferase gel1 [Verticillium alfalfae VaMs.102]|uniref:1,3-beta-glucanosyltransferase n=1 Tax=Verticillium alfalfae (strain VaMs.102 / ATCC MYA-4576 / FGSC 10136) TaxID=526221 RepID=C9S6B4_VERA1|nr:1,3-beta-glucanosyltransferase gel1 [Verticillium alfalfae VaMs.102]EEY14426.1 1,3-beta-glucanosyltransferase gel1 [Verticillium alfalfae VaMs.102]
MVGSTKAPTTCTPLGYSGLLWAPASCHQDKKTRRYSFRPRGCHHRRCCLQDDPADARQTRSLPAISVSGNAFWADGERFYIRGIDYQPGGAAANEDPLIDTEVCSRDIERFRRLGVNAVRVYSLDNNENHDECMDLLADAGIYLMADVNSPDYSINREEPHPSYNADYLQSVFATVEMFAQYDNTMLFFSGNEVVDNENNTDSAPYVKATTRDIKNYLRARGLRQVPVGYSAADVASNRKQTADYFNCGSDDARSDFFAFNDYSWCNTDFLTAGWDQKVQNFTDYGLPIFLSEFGCITNGERTFGEIESLMHSNMTSVYSGGMMYEYSMEDNDYGIVDIESNGEIEERDEFQNLADAFSRWPAPSGSGSPAHSTTHSVSCPTQNSLWEVDGDEIPTMPEEAEQYMQNGAGEGPGLRGPGSQNAPDSGTSTGGIASGAPSPTGSEAPRRSSDNGGSEDSNNDSVARGLVIEKGHSHDVYPGRNRVRGAS